MEFDPVKVLDAQEIIISGINEYRLATKFKKFAEPIAKFFGVTISREDAIAKLAIGREMLIDILSSLQKRT